MSEELNNKEVEVEADTKIIDINKLDQLNEEVVIEKKGNRRNVRDRIADEEEEVETKRKKTGPMRKLKNAKPQTFILDETLIDKLNRYVDENREITKSEFVREAIKAHMIRKKFY